MSDTLELMRALLGGACPDHAAARRELETAMLREVDPMLHCSVTHAISPERLMELAAIWLDCAFYPKVPEGVNGAPRPHRLEDLADIRVMHMRVLDRQVIFVAPGFYELLRLRERIERRPELRRQVVLIPEHALRDFLVAEAASLLVDGARQNLVRRWPYAAAHLQLTRSARYGFVAAVVLLITLILGAPYLGWDWLWPLQLLIVGPAAIRLAAIFTPLPPPQRYPDLDDAELPVYSVLVPLRNEAQMVSQLARGLTQLDYPAERLDIKFVVEATSPETVAAARAWLADPRFSVVVVPDCAPRTKPKALDFALPLCRGSHVVVFDAEDIPEPDQLRKAAIRFARDPDLACLQAPLVIGNGRREPLAALFAGEYAGLFGVLLPALACWRMPIPLGGTSNHFRVDRLRKVGGWDAFNVTEDADLGARLARMRMDVDVLDSATHEAAPTRFRPWLGQRTRWMKGWMQTFIVHNRSPRLLLAQMGLPALLSFELLTVGMIISPFLHCGMAVDTIIRVAMGADWLESSIGGLAYVYILALGYGSAFAMVVLGLLRLGKRELIAYQLLLPAYWLLIALATVRAMRELLLAPFYWFKSPHEPLALKSGLPPATAPFRQLT
jgi:cellulose synthase/poly-beta-1,6-N-acetylglucosamine synthase-like glycosyltransferase